MLTKNPKLPRFGDGIPAIKLSFNSTKYIIKDSNTICLGECSMPIKLSFQNPNIKKILTKFNIEYDDKSACIRFKVSGKTKCLLEDAKKYSEKLGEHIAESKMKRKAYKKALLIIQMFILEREKKTNILLKSKAKFDSLLQAEDNHVHSLMNNERNNNKH